MDDTADAYEDLTLRQASRDNKAKGGRGGRGRGRGGGRGGQSREVDLSRALSRLLRHQAVNAGIQLDGEGYAPLDRVVSIGDSLFHAASALFSRA